MALALPLTPEELASVAWLAQVKRAKLLKLPQPKQPGAWSWVKRAFWAWWQRRSDLKAFTAAIAEQAARISQLEDLLEANRLDVPGGRSDG